MITFSLTRSAIFLMTPESPPFLIAVRELGDDDRALAAAELLDVRAGAHHDPAAAGAVGVADPRAADDDGAGREVGPLTCFMRSSTFASGLSISWTTASIVSARLCGGMFVAIPTAIPVEPLTSRFGNRDGSDSGLLARLVVVRPEVDRVHVDVAQHLGREAREPALRVAHRGRRVVVDRAEVALAVDERVPERERLRHPDERVVDRAVAVGVVAPHDLADDRGGLLVRPVRLHAGVVHPPEDAAVDGLRPSRTSGSARPTMTLIA